jgi:hypothetical protein
MSENGHFFQTVKARVFKRILSQAGFVKGNRMYVRRLQNQIHGIQFQTATWGGVYFVNIGFSFDFLPGLMAMTQGREIEYTQFDLLDLLMYNRLEALMPQPYPYQWAYGREIASSETDLAMNSQNAIAAIDSFSRRWRNPSDFMQAFPPEVLESDEEESTRRIDIPGCELDKFPPLPIDRVLKQAGWYLPRESLAYSLAVIALRLKSRALAEKYLALAKAGYREATLEPLRRELKALVKG